MPLILNIAPDRATIAGLLPCASLIVISAKTQFFVQVKTDSTSQLIIGIFKLFQKLLKCFSGIIIFVFANESLTSIVFQTIFVFYLKDSELQESGLLGSSL